MNSLKSKPMVFEPRAEESVSEFLARAQSSAWKTQVDPAPGEGAGQYLFLLRTQSMCSVQQVAAAMGNAFPKLGISSARVARFECGDRSALSEDGIRVLVSYYGGASEKALALARVPPTDIRSAMCTRAGEDQLGSKERDFSEKLLANLIDKLRKEDFTS